MSFAVYPQPDACRAWMPTTPMPPGTSVPAPPLVCHMPEGHDGPHSNERRPSPLSRRWEGDARPEPAPRPAGQDTGHRQTAAEVTGCRQWGGRGPYCQHQRGDTGHVPWDQCRWVPVAAALAAADRDGYQRGREDVLREVGEWLDAAEDVDLTTVTVEAVRRRLHLALADRNDEKEGQ